MMQILLEGINKSVTNALQQKEFKTDKHPNLINLLMNLIKIPLF